MMTPCFHARRRWHWSLCWGVLAFSNQQSYIVHHQHHHSHSTIHHHPWQYHHPHPTVHHHPWILLFIYRQYSITHPQTIYLYCTEGESHQSPIWWTIIIYWYTTCIDRLTYGLSGSNTPIFHYLEHSGWRLKDAPLASLGKLFKC